MFDTDPEPTFDQSAPRAPRRVCCLNGQLSFGDARNRIACDIVNLSSSGAGIVVHNAAELADRIHNIGDRTIALLMQADRCVVHCSVVWIDRDRAGLKFQSFFMPMTDFRQRGYDKVA